MLKRLIRQHEVPAALHEAESRIQQMLDISHELFVASASTLLEWWPVDFDLYAEDRHINRLVVEVRRTLADHLASTPAQQAGVELVYLGVITDIERIGDYSKNILDLSKMLSGPLAASRYQRTLRRLFVSAEELFALTARALFEDDEAVGLEVMERHQVINETCEGIIAELLRDASVCGEEGIGLALTSRYFKRVSGHLKNVASTAINPYAQMGYFCAPGGKEA